MEVLTQEKGATETVPLILRARARFIKYQFISDSVYDFIRKSDDRINAISKPSCYTHETCGTY